jgi:hypothetical protein
VELYDDDERLMASAAIVDVIGKSIRELRSQWPEFVYHHSTEVDEATGVAHLHLRTRRGDCGAILHSSNPQMLVSQTVALILTAGADPGPDADIEDCMRQTAETMPLFAGVMVRFYGPGGERLQYSARGSEQRMNLGRYIVNATVREPGEPSEIRLYDADTGEQVAANDAARVADAVDGIAGEEPTR